MSRAAGTSLLDLVGTMQVGVAAGLSARAALELAVSTLPDLEWVTEAATSLASGRGVPEVLEEVAVATSATPLRSVAVCVRYGLPLAEVLARVEAELRRRRRRELEIAARRLPVRLLFPLVLCILPAFALVTVVPVVLAALGG